jgi:hypothetical protein
LAESKHKRTWSRSCSRGSRLAWQGRFGKARSRVDQPDDREVFHRIATAAALQELQELLPWKPATIELLHFYPRRREAGILVIPFARAIRQIRLTQIRQQALPAILPANKRNRQRIPAPTVLKPCLLCRPPSCHPTGSFCRVAFTPVRIPTSKSTIAPHRNPVRRHMHQGARRKSGRRLQLHPIAKVQTT